MRKAFRGSGKLCRKRNGEFTRCRGGATKKRRKSGSRKRRCKFGVNKITGSCLKTRRTKSGGRKRRHGRKCDLKGMLRMRSGKVREGCMRYRGTKDPKPLTGRWLSGPMRAAAGVSRPTSPAQTYSAGARGYAAGYAGRKQVTFGM